MEAEREPGSSSGEAGVGSVATPSWQAAVAPPPMSTPPMSTPPPVAAADSSDDEFEDEAPDLLGSPIAAGRRLEDIALDRARRRYDEEDPSEPRWKLHSKHIFVLSSAGKPVFSRYGDESQLAPQMGMLQALVSFVENMGDELRYISAGRANIVFLQRGALYLVAVCSSGETVEHVWRQLHLFHSQIISILTKKVEQIFRRNASYDVRGLLGGTDRVMRSLIHSATTDPAMLMRAIPCLRVPANIRSELTRSMVASKPSELLFGLMIAHNHLVTLLRPRKTSVHHDDVLLIMNTVASSTSFREDQAWLPICLPRFNASGFLYAHVSYVLPELCLVLLTPKADAFAEASDCRAAIAARLETAGELRDGLLAALHAPQYAVSELGVPEVRHCIYRLPGGGGGANSAGIDLYSAPRTGRLAGTQCPYHQRAAVKRLLRHYMLAHARVHHQLGKPLREYMQTTDDELIVVWTAADFELYVAFSPLVSKPVAYAACHKLHRCLKKETPNLFMLQAGSK